MMYEVFYDGVKIGLVNSVTKNNPKGKALALAYRLCLTATESTSGALHGEVIDRTKVTVSDENSAHYAHMA